MNTLVTAQIGDHNLVEPEVIELRDEEAVSDFMCEGFYDVHFTKEDYERVDMEMVFDEINENLDRETLFKMFELAQQHKVFELTKLMREMLKKEADNQISKVELKRLKQAA